MAFDECTPFPAEERVAAESMRLSMRWAARSRAAFVARAGYGQLGIVQGSVYPELRAESVEALTAIGFEGYAIGGLAVGEGHARMLATLDGTVPRITAGALRYLMGVGKPVDLVEALRRGVDLFDCVLPTRSGRTAQTFTKRGTVNLRNARHADDPRPLEEGCGCPASQGYSRGYLHHLIRTGEILGAMLLTWHNLRHYQDLMAGMRAAIEEGRFAGFAAGILEGLAQGDVERV